MGLATTARSRHDWNGEHVEQTKTLVVGGGPVGLFAALSLSERAVETRVVDARWERTGHSYACALHPESVRLLDEMGLVEPIGKRAHRVDRLAVYRKSERIACADFSLLGGNFPHVLTLAQANLEDALAAALEQRGIEALWQHEVQGLALHDRFVELATKQLVSAGPHEDPKALRAELVVAADGYYSPCRAALGIDAVSLEEPEAFAAFEFIADLSPYEHEAAVVFDGDSVSAFWPLGSTVGRWTFQVWERLDENASPELLRSLVGARAPWFTPTIEQVSWGNVTRFDRLIASEFGRDRIWLAGDAAHSTSPLGFQSMNRGFSEAHQIASMATAAIEGNSRSRSEFLRLYDETQQSEWRRLLGIETRIQSEGALSALEGARLVSCLPSSGNDLRALMAQVGLRFG